jgi:hypothetical protein
VVTFVPLFAYVMVLVCVAITCLRAPKPLQTSLVADAVQRYTLLIPLGLMGLWGFLGHVFFPEQAAAAIGWPTSPFQREVGLANLGIGVAGIVGFFMGCGFRFAVLLMAACFLGGAGVGHLIEMARTGDMATGNAGPILYTDFLTPIVLAVSLLVYRRTRPARAPG